jgi:hypothetical protein
LKNLEVGKDFSMNTSHCQCFHFTIDNSYEGESDNQKHKGRKRGVDQQMGGKDLM